MLQLYFKVCEIQHLTLAAVGIVISSSLPLVLPLALLDAAVVAAAAAAADAAAAARWTRWWW